MKAMARLIDADIALENIDEWLDTVGTALIGRGFHITRNCKAAQRTRPRLTLFPWYGARAASITIGSKSLAAAKQNTIVRFTKVWFWSNATHFAATEKG